MTRHFGLVVALFLALAVCGSGIAFAKDDKVKVICASRAETPPVIDGVLDDACWQNAEVHDDFISLIPGRSYRTTMRLAYDDKNLYLGTECFWDDVGRLKKLVDEMKAKPNFSEGFVDIANFTNGCSLELFLDPGATMRNHYQVVFNAAGQICGQFKQNWDPFSARPNCRVKITETGWTAEMVFPDQGIRKGDFLPGKEWGFNLARNDEPNLAVCIWKEVGAVFNEPKQFGRLIIGDYETWWQGVWKGGMVSRYETISGGIENAKGIVAYVYPMYSEVGLGMEKLKGIGGGEALKSRSGFENVYNGYNELYGLFHRLDALYATIESIARIEERTSQAGQ